MDGASVTDIARLKHVKLWTLEDRRIRADLLEVFKMVHGMSVVDTGTFFEIDNSNRTRGHTLKLKKGRVATDLRQHFFSERVINTWNHLDAAVIEAGTINTFKSRLQKLHHKDESVFGRYPFS